MSRPATVFWTAILGGSVLAIGVGFAGGRSYGAHALELPPRPVRGAPPPAAIRARELPRILHGSGSFDPGDDDPDPYGDPDRAVAARPRGWAPDAFDGRRERPRVAVFVVGADRAASAIAPFAAEPFPLAILIAPERPNPTLRIVLEGAKTALIACGGASLDAVAALRRDGAAGIACSSDDSVGARALVAANRDGLVVDDLLAGDALYHAARAARRRALTRDVLVDAREGDAYTDFLFAQALAIAERTGAATVAVHARPTSRLALERFAARASRDDVDLVEPAELAR